MTPGAGTGWAQRVTTAAVGRGTRAAFVAVVVGALLLSFAPRPALAVDPDLTVPGAGTGPNGSVNLTVWSGDVSAYQEGVVNATLELSAGATIKSQWVCDQGYSTNVKQYGPTAGGGAITTTINRNAGGFVYTSVGTSTELTYCAFTVWATAGSFRLTNASVSWWRREGVGGTIPTPTPAPTPTPGPTATAPPPGDIGNCADDGVLRSFAAGSRQCLADLDLGGLYPAGTTVGIQVRTRLSQSLSGQSKQHDSWVICGTSYADLGSQMTALTAGSSTGAVTGASGTAYFRFSHSSDSTSGGSEAMNLGGSHSITLPTGGCRYLALISDAVNAGSIWYSNGTSYINVQTAPNQSAIPSATASPTPTPDPSTDTDGDGYSDQVEAGAGTDPEDPSEYPGGSGGNPPPPPDVNVTLCGGGGDSCWFADVPEPNPTEPEPGGDGTPGNGGGNLGSGWAGGTCVAEYPKPGMIEPTALPVCTFPELVDVDVIGYIGNLLNWIGCLLSTLGVVAGNAVGWVISRGADLVVPSNCFFEMLEHFQAEIAELPPISWLIDVEAAVTASFAYDDAPTIAVMSFGSYTFDFTADVLDPVADAFAPYRPIVGAAAYLAMIAYTFDLVVSFFWQRSQPKQLTFGLD